MANTHKGRYFFILFLVIIFTSTRNLVDSSSAPSQHEQGYEQHHAPFQEPDSDTNTKLSQQEVLLYKLEELVKNLSEIVAKLEPKLIESSRVVQLDRKESQEQDRVNEIGLHGKILFEEEGLEGKSRGEEKAKAAGLVTKYSPSWSERFQFVSAVKLDSYATSVNVLPFRDFEGLSKYVAIGDDRGRVYVFLRNGDVLVEFHTSCDSPITAMVSHLSVYKNESIVVTGHQNGVVLIHKIYELSNGEEWSSITMENVGKCESSKSGEQGFPISILEVHHVGRLRYILSSDVSGMIRVFRENGTLHGSALSKSKPLAFLKQRLLFLTESGAGSLDFRSMRIRESECENLNNSLVRNYVFDAAERSKAYGMTSDGDVIHVLLLGDVMNFKCRVRSKKNAGIDGPLVLQAIKGYLLIANEEKVFVYNVSSPHYVRIGGPRPLFSANLDEIRLTFLNFQVMDGPAGRRKGIPLIASDREKLIVLGLGGGYVGMYRSNLPVYKGEFNTMLWTSPVLFFILFLFGAWQFFAKKKEALTSWGPDDPFSAPSVTTAAPLGSGSGDRAFVDSSSRNPNIMDLRTGGLGGPPRRYASSPPRYPGGATGSFRPATETNSRSSSVDPSYRASSELKFRGPALESTAFGNRRENLFANSQVAEEGIINN